MHDTVANELQGADESAAARRASRRLRVPCRSRRVRLRERDLDILLALAKMRLLRTSDLAALYFEAKGTCQKRMRKLYDAGLVRAVVTDLAAENRYVLTGLGHEFVARALPEGAVPPYRPAPRVDGRSVAHLDLLNRYRIALARGAAEDCVELSSFLPEWELRAREPHAPLVPDAAVRLGYAGAGLQLALEVDVGTEPPTLVLKKVERYEAAALQGHAVCGLLRPVVLFVASSARRARSISRAVGPISSRRVLVGALPWVLQDGGVRSGLAFPTGLARCDAVPGVDAYDLGLLEVLREPGRDGVAGARLL
ncbi:MAG: replication-relaxation family protein [Polyangiaceae bacterium]|nr:replication-relaxation family protein [Polyangiaceae bacterium]